MKDVGQSPLYAETVLHTVCTLVPHSWVCEYICYYFNSYNSHNIDRGHKCWRKKLWTINKCQVYIRTSAWEANELAESVEIDFRVWKPTASPDELYTVRKAPRKKQIINAVIETVTLNLGVLDVQVLPHYEFVGAQ